MARIDSRELGDAVVRSFPVCSEVGYTVAACSRTGSAAVAHHPGSWPIAESTFGEIYSLVCGFKPVIAMSLLRAVEGSADYLRDGVGPAARRVVSALEHRLDLPEYDALDFIARSDESRRQSLEAYSTHLETARILPYHRYGAVLSLAAAKLAASRLGVDADLATLVEDFCGAAGMTDAFCRRSRASRVGCLLDIDQDTGRVYGLLHDWEDRFLDGWWTGYVGGYSSAASMATYYRGVAAVAAGRAVDGFPAPEFIGHLSDIDASGEYWLGHETRVASANEDARLAARCLLGHAGFGGSSLGFADVDSGVGAFVVIRALTWSDDGNAQAWRNLIVDILDVTS